VSTTTQHINPFDRVREAKRYDVADMLLTGTTVSWNDIIERVGNFSPRTMGYVLRGLEDQGATILRLRDAEHGTLYRYDPSCEYDARFRLSKSDGPDAQRQKKHNATQPEAAES
jgi:hypothetical protein